MKKGFTLIELMVVIVIIGILAAIAVPKMFGMSAKAKVAEVGPAAATWVKLQQSYITEAGEAGNYTSIGYSFPGEATNNTSVTTNFQYTSSWADINTAAFGAINLRVLNKCQAITLATAPAAANAWRVNLTAAAGTAVFTATAPTATGCAELTPSFVKIGQ